MTRRMLGLLLSLCVEWSLVGDDWNLIEATALSGGPSQDAAIVAKDGLLPELRKAEYRRARTAAERDGMAVYSSDGKPGSALPKGLYELIWHNGDDGWDVHFRKVEPAGVPIPKPDRDDGATIRNFRMVEECVGSA